MVKNKRWLLFVCLLVFTIGLFFFLNNTTLNDILNSDHHYTNVMKEPLILESITDYELEEVKEKGKVNLEDNHTFSIENGSGFSYKTLKDRGENLVLRMDLNHNYSTDINKYIVPSEIKTKNESKEYTKSFQFKVFDSNRESVLNKINEVGFGKYEIVIDKDKAFESKRLDIFLTDYKMLVVN